MSEQLVEAAVRRLMLGIAPRISRVEAQALRGLTTKLTHRQYRILFQISRGRDSVSEIREVAGGTSLATLSESVETLCRRGLVERSFDESDRRRSVLGLTPEGTAALSAAEAAVSDVVSKLVASMDLDAFDQDGFCQGVDVLHVAVRSALGDAP